MSEEKGDKWAMPEPVFRQTSGTHPKEFVKMAESSPLPAVEPPAAAPDPADDILASLYAPPDDMVEKPPIVPAIKPAADIEPQPDISEVFTGNEMVGEPAPKVKSKRGFFGKLFIAFWFLILAAVAIGFVVLIYFLFFYTTPEIPVPTG